MKPFCCFCSCWKKSLLMETSLLAWWRLVHVIWLVMIYSYVHYSNLYSCFNSTSSTQRRTGTTGRMKDVQVSSKKGRTLGNASKQIKILLFKIPVTSSRFPPEQNSRRQTEETEQEKTSSGGLPRKRAGPQDLHGKVSLKTLESQECSFSSNIVWRLKSSSLNKIVCNRLFSAMN